MSRSTWRRSTPYRGRRAVRARPRGVHGAVQEREGYFREADGGTLFLDEIGEAPIEVQVMLLRALETGEVQPVGGRPGRRVDVRLLAATDANLERAVLQGDFRVSLLHRLGAYELRVPPLRERRDDIPRLLVHFLEHELHRAGQASRLVELGADTSVWLPTRLMAALLHHDWPGNVRQLSNTARRMVGMLLTGQPLSELAAQLSTDDGPVASAASAAVSEQSQGRASHPANDLSEDALLAAMEAHGWQISATARALGVSRKVLYARIAQSEHVHKARDLAPEALAAALAREGGDLGRVAGALQVSVRALQLRLRELKLRP
ncbi:sigma 54-interacting transcriptional regulator [Nannocystis sp.]|uniref:sigma 54-interacting transcriptional regulator n=1 Tax=Nannocystis sp. TaxID=1962667 RepID=UPI0025DEFF99|nr:sigma 54-interacting transcriptional regulator [Nannocystis sp.]MBK7823619.1 sigma-54-dependent Fis family transcriptional regulator [Nannocystis sp.]